MRHVAAGQALIRLVEFTDEKLHKLVLPADRRARLACGCHDLALEHQAGIALLVSQQLYGPAFALLRSLFEAYIRGMWLMRKATDGDLDKFEKDRLEAKCHELTDAYDEYLRLEKGPLTKLRETSWAAMNSFTHCGYLHVVRRNAEEVTGPNYEEEEIVRLIECSGVLGLLSALELAQIAGRSDLPDVFLEASRRYAANDL